MAVHNFGRFSNTLMEMLARHVSPDVLYVFKKTGLLITKTSVHSMTKEQMAAARSAAFEYQELEEQSSKTRH